MGNQPYTTHDEAAKACTEPQSRLTSAGSPKTGPSRWDALTRRACGNFRGPGARLTTALVLRLTPMWMTVLTHSSYDAGRGLLRWRVLTMNATALAALPGYGVDMAE